MRSRLLLCSLFMLSLTAPALAINCPYSPTSTLPNNQFAQMVQLFDGRLLIAETNNNRLFMRAENGNQLTIFGPAMPGGYGNLNKPAGVAEDAAGNIYVADQFNHRIVKLDPTLTPIAQWGTNGTGPGQLSHPTNLALSPDDSQLYVTELTGNRVSIFTIAGAFVSSFGTAGSGAGQFNAPFGIAVDAVGNVYVADQLNNRIQVFNSSGGYVSQFGSLGTGPGQFDHPVGLAFDGSGYLYVGDQFNNRVQVVTTTGVQFCQLGNGFGGFLGSFANPWWVYPTRDGSMIVADTNNFRMSVWYPNPTPTRSLTWGSIKTLYR